MNPRWPLQIPTNTLRILRLRGNVSRIVVSNDPFESKCSGLECLVQDLFTVMPCLTELLIGRHTWWREGGKWTYEFISKSRESGLDRDYDWLVRNSLLSYVERDH